MTTHYDLLNPQDYAAFAVKYGERCAKVTKFALAYGCKGDVLRNVAYDKACTPAVRQVDFDALFAAFGQGDKR